MLEITIISCYIPKKVQFSLIIYTFGYSQKAHSEHKIDILLVVY